MDFLSIFGAYDFAVRDGLTLCLVALSIHVLLAAGIFAVHQVGLMAIGAYTAAVLAVDLGVPFPISLLCGAVLGALMSACLAGLLIKLNGIYLAIASIAFSEVVRVAVLNLPFTGGSRGIVGIPRDSNDLWLMGVVIAGVVGVWFVERSRLGASMPAMRADLLMAAHQGIDLRRTRVLLFALSGALAAAAGALQVHSTGFVEPGQFDFDLLTNLLAAVIIGGMTYLGGAFVGALVVFGLPFTLDAFAEYQILVNGVLIVVVVAFAPGGILSLLDRRGRKHRNLPPEAAVPIALPPPPPDGPSPAGDTVLTLRGARMVFGGVTALDGVDLSVRAGEVLGIIGPNGSGKTTLLNVLSGAYRPTDGEGEVAGHPLRPLWGRPHLLARAGVSRTFQTICLMDDASALANVELGVRSGDTATRRRLALELLTAQGLGTVARERVGDLPYGLRRRVEIARALAHEPRLLLLDEPTAGMNPIEREEVFATVAAARAAGLAIIIVEHDVAMMRAFCDRLLVLDFGRPLAVGAPEDVLKSEEVLRAYIGSSTLA